MTIRRNAVGLGRFYHGDTEGTEEHGALLHTIMQVSQKYIQSLSFEIIGCAMEVHKHLGPGLLESVYQSCLVEELTLNHLHFETQKSLPIHYKHKDLGNVLRLDLVVEKLIIVEIKAVESVIPLYKAQLLSYLKLTGLPKGLLVNFHASSINNQLVSLVTENFTRLPKE